MTLATCQALRAQGALANTGVIQRPTPRRCGGVSPRRCAKPTHQRECRHGAKESTARATWVTPRFANYNAVFCAGVPLSATPSQLFR